MAVWVHSMKAALSGWTAPTAACATIRHRRQRCRPRRRHLWNHRLPHQHLPHHLLLPCPSHSGQNFRLLQCHLRCHRRLCQTRRHSRHQTLAPCQCATLVTSGTRPRDAATRARLATTTQGRAAALHHHPCCNACRVLLVTTQQKQAPPPAMRARSDITRRPSPALPASRARTRHNSSSPQRWQSRRLANSIACARRARGSPSIRASAAAVVRHVRTVQPVPVRTRCRSRAPAFGLPRSSCNVPSTEVASGLRSSGAVRPARSLVLAAASASM